jgi:cytochrome c peroxidase
VRATLAPAPRANFRGAIDIHAVALAGALALLGGAGCSPHVPLAQAHGRPAAPETAPQDTYGPITPVPPSGVPAPARAELGRRLFHEVRLSHDDSLSCAGCHPLDRAGVDHKARAIGIAGARGERNTPTVFNAALNFRQFWDGRAASLEAQIDGPVANPSELGSSWPEVIAKLSKDPSYVRAFEAAYSGPITADAVRDALATFERTLVYRGSRFDLFLQGDAAALTREEQLGCASCHQGANVGGNMFERLGVIRDFFGARGAPSESDLGRYNVTGRDDDRFVFRVPSLRLVSRTAPYFHDGSVPTLAEAIVTMASYQLGRHLPAADVHSIELFLESLAGSPEGGTGASSP